MNLFLSREHSLKVIEYLRNSSLPCEYDPEKHRIIIKDENNNELLYFRLPISVPPPSENISKKVNYVILLIQSGSCAVGYFEDGANIDHKVFKSYMVRMKQGKSQIKYLKTRGKSKAGSRVRLGETVDFFENINERLQEYFKDYKVDKVAISCSKILIPYLYNSKLPTPFSKNDARLFKIPKHVHLPNYEVIMEVNKFLQKGEFIYENENLLPPGFLEEIKRIQD